MIPDVERRRKIDSTFSNEFLESETWQSQAVSFVRSRQGSARLSTHNWWKNGC